MINIGIRIKKKDILSIAEIVDFRNKVVYCFLNNEEELSSFTFKEVEFLSDIEVKKDSASFRFPLLERDVEDMFGASLKYLIEHDKDNTENI